MQVSPLRIGIIGAGFCGTALAANLQQRARRPLEIILCEQTGHYAAGFAYRTPFPYHLLNVRAKDMSAFEDQPQHFVDWIAANPCYHHYFSKESVDDQFAPRMLYHVYLKDLLKQVERSSKTNLSYIASEIVDVNVKADHVALITKQKQSIHVDKVVLATGNLPPNRFPFPVSNTNIINNSWDYESILNVPKSEPVLIVGTGLSMIDAVLTLHQHEHQAIIYAVSRHGLLPLPHTDVQGIYDLDWNIEATSIRQIMHTFRKTVAELAPQSIDWRMLINSLRMQAPDIWQRLSLQEKRRFFRHLLPYWSIHRHRVHDPIAALLSQLQCEKRLQIVAGHMQSVNNGVATINCRTGKKINLNAKYLINCMGPASKLTTQTPSLIASLIHQRQAQFDALQMGLATNLKGGLQTSEGFSTQLFALGALRKGSEFECNAVPELRKQVAQLTNHLMQL